MSRAGSENTSTTIWPRAKTRQLRFCEIWIVFIFLAEYQEIQGIRRFMDFFVVDVFSLTAIFQVAGSETKSTTKN